MSNKWMFKLVVRPHHWYLGHKFVYQELKEHRRLILEAWCFGPLEWKLWHV